MSDTGVSGPSHFRTTSWSLLDQLRDAPSRSEAMEALIGRYWRPTYAYLLRRGFDRDDAREWTQEFFSRAYEHGWFDKAQPERGRFRTYLLTMLVRFVRDERRRAQNRFERAMRPAHLSRGVDDADVIEPPDTNTPEEAFLRQWADDIVSQARRRLHESFNGSPSAWEYDLFETRVESVEGERTATWDVLAERFGKTRDQVRYAFGKVQRQAKRILLDLMTREGGDPEAELADLIAYTRSRASREPRLTRPPQTVGDGR